jgi:hypothetical protein
VKKEKGLRKKISLFPGISIFANWPGTTGINSPGDFNTNCRVWTFSTLFLITSKSVTAFRIPTLYLFRKDKQDFIDPEKAYLFG